MARKKRLTRKEKKQLTAKRICWKCQSTLKKIGSVLKCENCDVEIVPSAI